MADDKTIRLKVVIDDDTRGADRAAKALEGTRKETEKLGTSSVHAAKDTRTLDEEIKDLKAHIVELGRAYDDTGDKSFLRDIGSDRSQIRAIERIKVDLQSVVTEGEKATEVIGGLGATAAKDLGGLSDVAGPLKYGLIAGAVAAVAEISPLIVGAIGGAISTAVGAGGIAVGLLAAAKDPAVKSAMATFGDELKDEFTAIGKPFVKPFEDALAILSADLKSLRLSDVFADAAPAVTGLAHAVGDFAKSTMPGFDAALQRSAPYMEQLDRGLMTVGEGLGSLLDDISASPGDLQAFRQALDLIGAGLAMTGKAIAAAGDAWHLLNHEWADFYHALGQAMFAMPDLAHQFTSLGDRLDAYDKVGDHAIATTDLFGATVGAASTPVQTLGTNMDLATAASGALRDSLSQTHLAMLGFVHADIGAEQAIDDLTASLKGGDKSFDVHTESGRKNLRLLEELAAAAAEAAKQTLAQTGSVDKAQAVYEGFRQELLKMLVATGMNRVEAQKLVDQWLGMDGLTATLTIKVKVKKEGEASFADLAKASFGTAPHRATGGPVMAGQAYMVGEQGPEPFIPSVNGTILPHSALQGPAGGGGVLRHELVIRFSGAEDEFTRFFRKIVSVTSGGDVQTYVTG